MTPAVFQRVGRPWSYFDEEYLYHEHAWSRSIEGSDNTEHGYQVLRTINPSPVVHTPDDSPTKINAALETLLTDEEMIAAPETMIDVQVRLRDFPDWDIPLLPASMGLSAEDALTVLDERETALAARTELFEVFAEPVVAHVEASGGEIFASFSEVGWLGVRVPWSSLPALIDHPALARVTLLDAKFNLHWNLGDGRTNSHMDTDRFLTAGFNGEQSNSGRHAFGNITVGVIDDGFEDEACVFWDGANCTGTSRIQEKFLCDENPDAPPFSWCAPVVGGNYAESDEESHGTRSSSVILGDYVQGQACNASDPPWASPPACNDAAFTSSASGIAPEARLMSFAIRGKPGSDPATNDIFIASQLFGALQAAVLRHVDIVNMSLGILANSANCEPVPDLPFEEMAENAFDDGILVVASVGNNPPGGTTCNMESPADLIKTLAVAGFDSTYFGGGFPAPTCASNYRRCPLAQGAASRGGASAVVNGATHSNALSLVDLVAPTNVSRVTNHLGANGKMDFYNGSSAAAPHVSGAAALLKSQYLANGQTWINSPGRLHSIMLAHADRHFSSNTADPDTVTTQKTRGADPAFGLGRLKMRLLANGSQHTTRDDDFKLRSFASATTDHTYYPFAGPMPTGTAFVKCVMNAPEDMSGKPDISDMDLRLRVAAPVNGTCVMGSGATLLARNDLSRDTKSMVAFESADVTLAGACLEVTLDNFFVTSAGVTTMTYCYLSNVHDDL